MEYNNYSHNGKGNQQNFNPFNCTFEEALQRIKEISAKEDNALGYTLPVLIDTPLPHSDPGEVREYHRYNGKHKMIIQSPRQFGYPYGGRSRVILTWLISECMKNYYKGRKAGMDQPTLNHHARHIYHGSIKEILEMLGYNDATGGKNGSITHTKKHFEAVLNASFNHLPSNPEEGITQGFGRFFISKKEYIEWPHYNGSVSENSYIKLSADIYESIIDKDDGFAPVPIDLRALNALRDSPLAMDLYCWLTRECRDMLKELEPEERWYSWSALKPQFGDDYKETKAFGRKARKALKKIALLWQHRTHAVEERVIYRGLNYETPRGRLRLLPSPAHVPPIN